MRRWTILWRVLFAFMAFTADISLAAAEGSVAHRFCRMTVGGPSAAFDACVSRQIEGARAIARRLSAVRGEAKAAAYLIEVYDECRTLWLPDYALIDQCLAARLEGE